MNSQAILEMLQGRVPDLLAIYAFGGRIQGTAGPESDLDLAVLVAGYADPLTLWELSGDLADIAGTVAIIQKHLDEFLHYSQGVLRDAAQAAP